MADPENYGHSNLIGRDPVELDLDRTAGLLAW